MAVTDLHTLDISAPIDKLFSAGRPSNGVILSLVEETPQINIGENAPLVIDGRAKGSLVHEGGKKKDNGRAVTAKPFTTAKLVYSQRFTDEFMAWSEERQADMVSRLVNDWVTKSLPRDLDTVVIHGIDPSDDGETADSELSDYIRKTDSHISVTKTGDKASQIDTDLSTALSQLSDNGTEVTGIALSSKAAAALSGVMNGNVQKYPELSGFGLSGNTIAGRKAAASVEVGKHGGTNAIIGDFSQLLLGFAGQANWKTIEYGDPDNTGKDLQGYNQIMIRLELMFGFRVLDPKALAVVETAPQE